MSIKIDDIEILCRPNCKIKDKKKVENIINEFILKGPRKLQVVSDFDFTITKQRQDNGKKVLTSFGMFNKCKSLPKDFLKNSYSLFEKYRPIEIDPHISVEEKTKHMIEWWTLTSNLLRGFEFPAHEIDEVAKQVKEALRDGTELLFKELSELNVPVLVFSAGLGDSVVLVLHHANILFDNVKVISNFLQFENGYLNGFQERMIHTFNKNETALQGTDYYNLVHDRDHILIMGDSLGDAGMADGVPQSSHVLKIGFLYDHAEQNLPSYMETFDIVLIDDQSMDVPRALLGLMRSKETINTTTTTTEETTQQTN